MSEKYNAYPELYLVSIYSKSELYIYIYSFKINNNDKSNNNINKSNILKSLSFYFYASAIETCTIFSNIIK